MFKSFKKYVKSKRFKETQYNGNVIKMQIENNIIGKIRT